MCLLLIVAAIYGYYPTIYTIQIVYYSFCLFIFVLALSYTTCAVVVFFRDLSQIISIGLQIGMWATPILWNLDSLSGNWITILKLNPLVYIVNGYRSAIYEKEWFSRISFHHVFLDCNGSTVRVGSRYFQTIEGTFRRRAIIRMIVTISRVRRTEKSYYKKQSIAKLL